MLTVGAAASLSGLCAGYAALTRPIFSVPPPSAERMLTAVSGPALPPETGRWAREFLPDEAWAASAKYQVRNGRTFLYTNSWEPVEGQKAVRLAPFALVLQPDAANPDKPPLTIVAEAAVVRFAGSIDLNDPDPGRIVGGMLQGAVRLRGAGGLELDGRDFTFAEDALRLWSDEEVAFKHGPHAGRGRRIQIDLLRVGAPESFDAIAVSGVAAVRLLRDVQLDLDPKGQQSVGLLGGSAKTPTVPASGEAASGAPLRVTSQGPFVFDLQQNVATFEQQVRCARPLPDGTTDTLDCDKLTLEFEPETPAAQQAAADRRAKIAAGTLDKEDGFQAIDEGLALRQLLALGSARTPVVLTSPANDFVAEAGELTYDLTSGITTLEQPADGVVVRQGETDLVSPVVRIEPTPGGGTPTVACDGAGWIRHSVNGEPTLNVWWQTGLRRFRDANSGMDIIRLTGAATVQQPKDDFTLTGDLIELHLEPAGTNSALRPTERTTASPAAAQLIGTGKLEPKRLIARTGVKLASPDLRAQSERLDVVFVDAAEGNAAGTAVPPDIVKPPAAPVAPVGETQTRVRSRQDLQPAAGRIELAGATLPPTAPPPEPVDLRMPLPPAPAPPLAENRGDNSPRSPVEDRGVDTPRSPIENRGVDTPRSPVEDRGDDTPRSPVENRGDNSPRSPVENRGDDSPRSPEPILLKADAIAVLVDRPVPAAEQTRPAADQKQPSTGQAPAAGRMREVRTSGGVIVQQNRDAGEPLLIRGDRLDLINRGEGQELVHIHGRPATTNPDGSPGLARIAAEVHDGGASLYGMNIHLDRAANRAWSEGEGVLQLPIKADPNGKQLDTPQQLNVWWTEGMTFDGNSAMFLGDVRTVLNTDRMYCHEMEVRLTSRFDFAAAGTPSLSGGSGPRPSTARPEIAEVFCRHGVEIKGQEYEAGSDGVTEKLVSVRRAEFGEFHLDQRTGDTVAQGPGWITLWRRGEPNRAAMTSDNAVRSNAPIQKASDRWEYLRIEFAGTSAGNIRRRSTTFNKSTTVVYGPVADTNKRIDPDALPPEAGMMTCQALTVTQHPPADAQKAYAELQAEGNVYLVGRGFTAQSDTVSFDESKGLYILRSFGNRDAEVFRQTALGGDPSRLASRRIEIIPSQGIFRGDRTTGFEGLQ